ncbi:MAG TPA: hypothetical protein VJN18_02890 [Polyangiaceae bacterium]|nr:hypothetical protein [Polyangiaceae bacterium]
MAVTMRDERGAVYVEFLLAFLPLFVLFLALCQIALLVAGKVVVRHAAFAAARSAIVVLDDEPLYYGDAPRGVLSETKSVEPTPPAAGGLANALSSLATSLVPETGAAATPVTQRGARMRAIRGAALRPLSAIAPSAEAFLGGTGATLADAVIRDPEEAKGFATVYADAAALVTLHRAAGVHELAAEPILHNTPITVRVTYLQLCGVPLVRNLICHQLGSLLDASTMLPGGKPTPTLRERLARAGAPAWLEAAADPAARFMAFEAEVTLPNQGALYEYAEAGDAPLPEL